MNRDTLLAASPWIEVLVKSLYWRSSVINNFFAQYARKNAKPVMTPVMAIDFLPLKRITSQLKEFGVHEGEIMVVHASGLALKPTGLTPTQLCSQFLDLLGPEGTLAMPAIPLFRDESKGPERLTDSICAKRLIYDVHKTPPWTGALPKALMRMPGAIRSRHPLNSMVAVGYHAASMMQGNIDGDRPMACGPNSSWKYCSDRNAHIVCLGVDTAHSLTMIHVAEDSWVDEWPIANWYRDRLFHIKDRDFEIDLTVRERRPHWAIYYGERTLQKELINCGILKVATVDSLRIETCESAALIEFLNGRKSSGYPYWVPFWVKSSR